MTKNEKNSIIWAMVCLKVRNTFEVPNSDKSKSISKRIARTTGLSSLEVHRFHNAILNDNAENSFTASRREELARIILKDTIARTDDFLTGEIRGQLSTFANRCGYSFNNMLEVVRELLIEIVNDVFAPQSKA